MLSLRDSLGCRKDYPITIGVDNNLMVPNIFTPNGDGVNDFFSPILQCPFPAYRLQVFNRWGQLIFETDDPKQGWDGAFNDEPAPSEVYFYQLSYQEFEGEPAERRQGDVVLLR